MTRMLNGVIVLTSILTRFSQYLFFSMWSCLLLFQVCLKSNFEPYYIQARSLIDVFLMSFFSFSVQFVSSFISFFACFFKIFSSYWLWFFFVSSLRQWLMVCFSGLLHIYIFSRLYRSFLFDIFLKIFAIL